MVYRIAVTGTVENGLAPYVARTLREAEAAGAAAAYLDIDTPGGRVDAAERISDAIRRATVPVYAFVNPRAFSAGALIAHLRTRGLHAARRGAWAPPRRWTGRARGRPRRWSRPCGPSSGRWRRSGASIPGSPRRWWTRRSRSPASTRKGELLTLTSGEARKVGYAKGEVADEAGAARRPSACPARRSCPREPNWAEQVVRFLTNPLVSPLLLSLGVLGLVFEIKSGAFGLGGLVSLASLGLFFGSSFLLGLAGWEEVLLLGLGLIALAVEVFVLPGFGVAGFLGLARDRRGHGAGA